MAAMRTLLLALALFCGCEAFVLLPAARSTKAVAAFSVAPVARTALPEVTMLFKAPAKGAKAKPKKAAKKVVKKVAKKPVKKVAKKVVKKTIKKVAKKSVKKGVKKAAQLGNGYDVGILANYGLDGLKGYGAGNGEVLFSPGFIATAAAWVFVLFKFVLRIF